MIRTAATVAVLAGTVSVVALLLSAVGLAAKVDDREATRSDPRLRAGLAAHAAITRAATHAPRAIAGRCVTTAPIPGQGHSCVGTDGMYVLPEVGARATLTTHGPDLVAATPRVQTRAGGFGSRTDIVCSAGQRSHHVLLAYLIPADFAGGGAGVHGDRFSTIQDQLRGALYDASALVDRSASALAPGSHRRIRALCDPDGVPQVRRVVLPRSAATYRQSTGGFALLLKDVRALGLLPAYPSFDATRTLGVRRMLAYYDADFLPGVAGQGTLMRRSKLLASGLSSQDPLVSKTVRSIHNNPPEATLAIQYGTGGYFGPDPDPPLYTSLLHELTHTLGGVQDESPTSSLAGHCIDGVDVMCYDDGGERSSSYDVTACPYAVPSMRSDEDERYDCNGDTYFHPAPAAGTPLASSALWNLGARANETFTPDVIRSTEPAGTTTVVTRARGTNVDLRWRAVYPLRGRRYELWARTLPSGAWEVVGESAKTSGRPRLRPATTYQLTARAVDASGDIGVGAPAGRYVRVRTGMDTSAPSMPTGVAATSISQTTTRLRWIASGDNVRVTSYRLERLVGTRWTLAAVLRVPASGGAGVEGAQVTSSPVTRLAPASTTLLRVIAVDQRGNRSTPSRAVKVHTRG